MADKNTSKAILTVVVSLIFASFFMWLALRGLDFEKIKSSLSRANYFWVFFAAIFGVLAYWFRAVRWNILLEPLGYRISNSNSFWTISFGYLMNLTIPRSGELARSTALYSVEKVPVDKSFGTIILERVVDLVCMILFLFLVLIFKFDAISAFYKQANFHPDSTKITIVLSIVLLCGIAFFSFRKSLKSIPVFAKVIGFIDGILSGFSTIFKLKQPVKFILYSLAIWVCYYLAAYLVCFALPETAGFSIADGFFIIVVGTLGMMVPASGGIGAFHFALKIGIGALFLSMGRTFEQGSEAGLAYAFISHTMQLVIMLVLGFISIPILANRRQNI